MKLQAQIGDIMHEVEIKRDGDRVFARVDGQEYDLEVSEPEPNVFLFKDNGKISEYFVIPPASPGAPTVVSSQKGEVEVTLIDPKRLRRGASAGTSTDGAAEIKTMMPGKVVRLVAAVGVKVEKGDSVLVVEAMKMQNELRSPKAGSVKEIRVEVGATVGAGEVLAVVE